MRLLTREIKMEDWLAFIEAHRGDGMGEDILWAVDHAVKPFTPDTVDDIAKTFRNMHHFTSSQCAECGAVVERAIQFNMHTLIEPACICQSCLVKALETIVDRLNAEGTVLAIKLGLLEKEQDQESKK